MSLLSACNKIISHASKGSIWKNINTTIVRNSSLWEPSYFEEARKQLPEYDLIDVQMKGYDYPVLESFQSLVHRIAKTMDIPVIESYAVPFQHYKIVKYRPKSEMVDSEYQLKLYERNVQIGDVKTPLLPIFIDAITTACPPGVKLSIHEHTPEIAEVRYVPEYEVLELREKIDELNKQLGK